MTSDHPAGSEHGAAVVSASGPREVPGHPDYRIYPDGRYECRRNQAGAIHPGRWYPRKHAVRRTAGGRCSLFKFRNRDTEGYTELKAVNLIMELFGTPKPATKDIGGVPMPVDPAGLIVVIRVPDQGGRLVEHDHDDGNPDWLHIDLLAWGYKQPRAAFRPARRRPKSTG